MIITKVMAFESHSLEVIPGHLQDVIDGTSIDRSNMIYLYTVYIRIYKR